MRALEVRINDFLHISRILKNIFFTGKNFRLIGVWAKKLQPISWKSSVSCHFLLGQFLANSKTPPFLPRPKDSKMVWQSSVGSKLAELWLKIEGAENGFSSGLILKIIKNTGLAYPKNFFLAKTLYLLYIEMDFSKNLEIWDPHGSDSPIKLWTLPHCKNS